MKRIDTATALAVAIFASLVPPALAAESVVPPENSAANQYTEAIPTAGGNKATGGGDKGGRRTPATVLGARNAHRLEAHGKQGREVAEVVAETAPSRSAPPEERQGGKAKAASHSHHEASHSPHDETPAPKQSDMTSEQPSGSSGPSEVLAVATGSSSSGQLGVLLPLAIAAAIAWAIAFLLRRRRRAG